MTTQFNPRALAVSQKIYGWLLRAYPPRHRAEYGPAMAQLFRDQCRDAWKESQTWGLAKLWLRVLPDLVSTSIRERIAALNERKTMNEKIASLSSDRTTPTAIFIRVFIAVFLITVIAATAITFILPESYASTARIMIEPAATGMTEQANATPNPPVLSLQDDLMVILSDGVLEAVINKLNLNVVWGKKYFSGEDLKPAQTIRILKSRLLLAVAKGSKIIAITVYSDDSKEAAQIANSVVDAYRNYRLEVQGKLMGSEPSAKKISNQSIVVLEQAQPGLHPVRPNKPLNIFIGVVAGGFLGLVIGGAAAFATAKLGGHGGKSATLA